jgi:NADPH:quinone reductase-like Zn-dependent oxidoreductase
VLALITTATPPYVELTGVPDPVARAGEVLVRVNAVSLNRGEVLDLPTKPPGSPAGWDFAGTREDGTRVVGLVRAGAWAERIAVPENQLAPIPGELTDAHAAALPTAGLTALKALEVAGSILGKRVLVTGATGGVGRMAVQLAHASGAHVTALVRAPAEIPGAHATVQQIDDDFDVIIDCVGAGTFAQAIEHLARRGVVVNLATQGDETVAFKATRFDRSPGARIYTLNLWDEFDSRGAAPDLQRLLTLGVDPNVTLEASWRDPAAALQALIDRRVSGKVVLHIEV